MSREKLPVDDLAGQSEALDQLLAPVQDQSPDRGSLPALVPVLVPVLVPALVPVWDLTLSP